MHHRDVRANAERHSLLGADACDPAHAERDREVKEADGVDPDRNVLSRARRAGPGGHRAVHPRLDPLSEATTVSARDVAKMLPRRGMKPIEQLGQQLDKTALITLAYRVATAHIRQAVGLIEE